MTIGPQLVNKINFVHPRLLHFFRIHVHHYLCYGSVYLILKSSQLSLQVVRTCGGLEIFYYVLYLQDRQGCPIHISMRGEGKGLCWKVNRATCTVGSTHTYESLNVGHNIQAVVPDVYFQWIRLKNYFKIYMH